MFSRRQGMLNQGHAPDSKCELNITSSLTLSHPLHPPICAKDIMVNCTVTSSDGVIVRLGGGSFMLGFWWGTRGWVSYFFYFLFCFCAVLIILSWLIHDSLLCLFHSSFLNSLFLVSLIRRY